MFEDRKDWARRRRVNLMLTGAAALLGLALLIWRPEGDLARNLGFFAIGAVSVGVMFHVTLFRAPRDVTPAQIDRIEASTLQDARRVMLWAWAIGILWTASWLTAGVDPGLGLPLGGLLFLISLVICLIALPVFMRDLRRDGLGVFNARLDDETTRAFRIRADAAAMQAGLITALWLSALSVLELWPLAGHELGFLTAGAMVLTQLTRRWQLERAAEPDPDSDA